MLTPNSPDFNLIERLWDELDILRGPVESMPRRVKADLVAVLNSIADWCISGHIIV